MFAQIRHNYFCDLELKFLRWEGLSISWSQPYMLLEPHCVTCNSSPASQIQPALARIAFSITHDKTESDPHWGWLGLACETNV